MKNFLITKRKDVAEELKKLGYQFLTENAGIIVFINSSDLKYELEGVMETNSLFL